MQGTILLPKAIDCQISLNPIARCRITPIELLISGVSQRPSKQYEILQLLLALHENLVAKYYC